MFGHLATTIAALALIAVGLTPSVARAQEWEDIQCVPADRSPSDLFDVVRTIDDLEAAEHGWVALQGDQNAGTTLQRDKAEHHGGEASLRVDYDFKGGRYLEYVQISTPVEFTEPGQALGFWLKDDGTPFPLRLRLADQSGETHQTDMIADGGSGWRFVALSLDAHSSAWGGDANKRKDYPLRLAGICFDRLGGDFSAKGSLWVDDVQLLKPREVQDIIRVQAAEKRFGNLYAVDETVRLLVKAPGHSIRWTVTGFDGQQTFAGESGSDATGVAFNLPRPGYYECRIEALADGVVKQAVRFCAAAMPDAEPDEMSDFLGVNCHFGQNAYPLDCMPLLLRYGINRFRDELSWRRIEVEKGRYVMPDYCRAYVDRAGELGLHPLVIFDYNNPYYDDDGFPNSPEGIKGFTDYAVEIARQTEGIVSEFEVWNEWIGGCGMGGRPGDHSPEAYGRLLKATYEAVKSERPDLTIVGIGGEYGPMCAENVTRAIDTSGPESLDAFSIHPYRYPRAPETSGLVDEVSSIRDEAVAHGAAPKVWITEIGYPTHRGSGGSPDEAQARMFVRTLALLQSTSGVEQLYWYDLKDDGIVREYNEHNFGLLRHQQYNCAPKPGIVAAAVYSRRTAGATAPAFEQDGDTCTVRFSRADGSDLLIAWTIGDDRAVRIEGQVAGACDLMGAALPAQDKVTLSQNPVYVWGDAVSIAGVQ